MTAKHDNDGDSDANFGICDVTSSFYLCYDDVDDATVTKRNNAVITIWPILLITLSW